MQLIASVKDAAPTWSPETEQENWSDRRRQSNFIKAWGGPSPCGSGRVMPHRYGARSGGNQGQSLDSARRFSSATLTQRNLDVSRIELGPTRRDPLGPLSLEEKHESVLQSASAMGSFAVSRASERQPSGTRPRSTSFDIGFSVTGRLTHVNRAFVRPSASMDVAGRADASNHRQLSSFGSDRRCSFAHWGTHG